MLCHPARPAAGNGASWSGLLAGTSFVARDFTGFFPVAQRW
jgi:hypothetical protein